MPPSPPARKFSSPSAAGGRPEPLRAIYHRDCRSALERAFAAGIRKVTAAFAGIPTTSLLIEQVAHFQNVNTPEDWAAYDRADPFPHYIEFRHVYKTFDRPVLVDSNFHVDPGETVAIIGRSGVGKSVTLSHIMGFLKPDSGRMIVAHEDITDCTKPKCAASAKR